jgi:small subunit ribosomal protein S1
MSETEQQHDTPTASAEAPAPEPEQAAAAAADEAGSSDEASARSAKPELPEGELSFAELFELAEKQSKERKKAEKAAGDSGLRVGKVVEAKIVVISGDSVFVDLGGKAEGQMAQSDLLDDDGEFNLAVGDTVEGRIVSIEGGAIKLGKAIGADSVRNRDAVRQAHETGLPIEGRVTGKNKGGLDVEVGGLRAFCPISQIDLRFTNDSEQFIGQKLMFKITEFKNNGRNVVVSRRVLLEEEQKRKMEEIMGRLEVGSVVIGEVTSVKDYGAFVDLGGIEGLVHVSEITHERIGKPSEKLSIGMQMSVKVIKIEDGKKGEKKISLSMKQLERDPWEMAAEALKVGQKVMGSVQRIQPFGAFVEILPGVDGLIHVSNMSNDRVAKPQDVLKVGDEVEATIIGVDLKKKRIGLSLVKSRQELAGELAQQKVYDGTVDKIEGFGLFVKLPTGARGLVPAAESGTQRGTDLSKEFKIGDTVKVVVLDADKKSGKIRLSIRQAAEAEERALYSSYMNQNPKGKGLGTFADLLKDRFPGIK